MPYNEKITTNKGIIMNKLSTAILTVAVTPVMLVVAPKHTLNTYKDMINNTVTNIGAKSFG